MARDGVRGRGKEEKQLKDKTEGGDRSTARTAKGADDFDRNEKVAAGRDSRVYPFVHMYIY
jgi:hypothetical protein